MSFPGASRPSRRSVRRSPPIRSGALFSPRRRPRRRSRTLRGEVRVLGHLVAVNAKIAELSDEDALLDAILDASVELLGARRGFLLLAAEDHVVVRRARRSGQRRARGPGQRDVDLGRATRDPRGPQRPDRRRRHRRAVRRHGERGQPRPPQHRVRAAEGEGRDASASIYVDNAETTRRVRPLRRAPSRGVRRTGERRARAVPPAPRSQAAPSRDPQAVAAHRAPERAAAARPAPAHRRAQAAPARTWSSRPTSWGSSTATTRSSVAARRCATCCGSWTA